MTAENPSLAIGLALLAGTIGLVAARHARLPSIVLLLGLGVVLGPDVLGWIQPSSLGDALPALVAFGVAIILFEGGLNLDIRRLRREAPVIRRLVGPGAIVTAIGGALAARWCMQWDWTVSILFGTLVIVTGPTVMAPLLRRIKVKRNVETVLEAEGVLIDPIGAIIALVALEIAISPSPTLGGGAMGLLSRLGFGFVAGALSGWVLGVVLRHKWFVPAGLENILSLALVLALYQICEAVLPESGIMAVTVAGLIVGNMKTRVHRDLQEFKEQLTLLLISLLFVLLAADVRLSGVLALGWPGALTVAALMLVVRPLNMLASTVGTPVAWNERAFMAWLAPRGIVAAAVASHFNHVLHDAGIPGGEQLLALVFLVIASTVIVQGLTGGWVASLLGVRLPPPSGICVLGANKLARTMARVFVDAGRDVTLIDSSSDFAAEAEREGLRVVFGNGLEERTMLRARMGTMRSCIGLTANEAANLIFADTAHHEFGVENTYVALRKGHDSVSAGQVAGVGAQVLFGEAQELERWYVRLERDLAVVERWVYVGGEAPEAAGAPDASANGDDATGAAVEGAHQVFPRELLPLASTQKGVLRPFHGQIKIGAGDEVVFVRHSETEAGSEWLNGAGWTRSGEEDATSDDESAQR